MSLPTVGSNPTLSAERKVLAKSLDFDGLPALDLLKTDVKEQGFTLWRDLHARDHSVPAGRSQLISDTPSLYVLRDS